jgi:hypothetical protein
MTSKALAFVFIAILASCGHAEAAKRAVLSGSDGGALFKQCSRDVPSPGEGQWKPTDLELDSLEATLPAALSKRPEAKSVDFTKLLSDWGRQYVGFVRDGKRYIYGNFFAKGTFDSLENELKHPMIVCDGGPYFFGVEYDVSAQKVTRLDFNGSI